MLLGTVERLHDGKISQCSRVLLVRFQWDAIILCNELPEDGI